MKIIKPLKRTSFLLTADSFKTLLGEGISTGSSVREVEDRRTIIEGHQCHDIDDHRRTWTVVRVRQIVCTTKLEHL